MLTLLAEKIDIGEQFITKDNKGIGQAGSGYGSLGEVISAILPNVYIIAGLIIFVMVISGGFAIIGSGNNPQQKEKGSKIITSAVIGFALIFTSFWLIKLIEYLTGIKIFSAGL